MIEGSSLVALSGLLIVASLVAEQGLQGSQASALAVPGLQGTGSRAQALGHRLGGCGAPP